MPMVPVIGTLPVITAGYIISTVLTLGIAAFVLAKGPRHKSNIFFVITAICIAIFDISFAIATNSNNLAFARIVWTANIINIFIALFYSHWIFSAIEKIHEHRLALRAFYVSGIAIFVACIVWPQGYWMEVVPRLYLKSFIHGGPLYLVMLAYFLVVSGYTLWALFKAHKSADPREQNRLKYFIFASFFGYGTGITAFPLTFGIPLDPILSMLTASFVIPIAYGIVKAEIMDFRIAIRWALVYGAAVGVLSGLLLAVNLANDWFLAQFPGLGLLTIPLLISLTAILIGREIWIKFKQTDELKYEFITVAAHKLRTPLTRIKWGIASLAQTLDSLDDRTFLNKIDNANDQLIRISDVILEAAQSPADSKNVRFEHVDLGELVREVIKSKSHAFSQAHINISHSIPLALPPVYADLTKTKEVLEIVLNNAACYTEPGGHVKVDIKQEGNHLICRVSDSGIGITADELPLIFDRFYRSPRAILIDTEGLGLGLYLAKNIAEQMGGHLNVKSQGAGLGSSFSLSLKIAS